MGRKERVGKVMYSGEAITLAAQVDGPDAVEPTNIPHSELRRLLRRLCKGPYSPDVDEFAPILRIDGSIHQWKREGCAYLRRSLKERYITIDIFVPISRWKNRSEREIREYFASHVREALTLCIKRLQKDKTPVDAERLLKDYEKVVKQYLM
jgi:hypothetical protein